MNLAEQDNTAGTEALNASPALVLALKRLLRPLVRLLLAKGITYPYLCGLLKTLFVDVAAHDFPLKGKRQTDSRLSLLTGVHRKDVHRFMNQPRDTGAAPANVSFGARLVARWCGEADYLDESGEPLPLPRLAGADGGPSFERLVADESKDIRARAVLDEWRRLGLVTVDGEDRICLRTGAFVPEEGFEEKAYFLGRNVRDHLAAATHNVLDGKPPFLERSVYSDGLNEAATAELAALSERLGMNALRAINRRARALRADSANDPAVRRVTFGVYFFSEAQLLDGEADGSDA
jgi:hypothetical protein